MQLAVLLLRNSDAAGVVDYDREWVHRMVAHTAGYFADQSGDREILSWRVFDWVTLPMTAQQWDAAGFGVGPLVVPMVQTALQVDLAPYTHVALVIDRADASLAAVSPSNPTFVHIAARDFDPALLQHEMGHFFGAGHANLATPSGPAEYGDRYCVMGAEGGKFSYQEHSLDRTDPASGAVSSVLSDSGPGMAVPTLLATSWLQAGVHGIDLQADLDQDGTAVVTLPALTGAPAADRPVPVFAHAKAVTAEPLTVEVRWADGWDRAVPASPEAPGWVLVHTANQLGAGASCLLRTTLPATAGQRAYLEDGELGVQVEAVDPAGRTARVRLEWERQQSRYGAIWRHADELGHVPWQARHGITEVDYQRTFDELLAQGYRLVDVDGHWSRGAVRFSGLWRQQGGPAWQARHGLTAEQYQHTFDQLTATGHRPVSISGYLDRNAGGPRYAAIWEQVEGPAWMARHGISAAEHQALFDTLPAQGWRPVHLDAFTADGQDFYSSIWHQVQGAPWIARHGLSAAEYQGVFDELTPQGWRLVELDGYGDGGASRWMCLWEQGGGAWRGRHNLSPFRYQQQFDVDLAEGFVPVRVTGHNPWS